jgi:hypothetical protein
MDMKNNNLNKKKEKLLLAIMLSLPDACAGIGKLAVDVG